MVAKILPDRGGPIEGMGEFDLIDRIRRITGPSSALMGIGDDAAVIDLGGPEVLLATVDMQVQNVHFGIEQYAPADLGRRAVAVNLSDIAAMGGTPRHVLVSLALPPDIPATWVEELYQGMATEAGDWDADIIGGNISRIQGPICVDVIILGSVPPGEVVPRSGGRPGDLLAVTGSLGNAAALRSAVEHALDLDDLASPEWIASAASVHPRVREGRVLAGLHLAHAMLDLSDGLAGDLQHLCRASGVGAEIDARRLPIDDQVWSIAAALGLDALDLAISGGEDYELLIALGSQDAEAACEALASVGLHVIGRLEPAAHGITLLDWTGRRHSMPPSGWTHF